MNMQLSKLDLLGTTESRGLCRDMRKPLCRCYIDRITYLDDEQGNGFLISHTAVTRVPNRIFQMFAIPCLYLGQGDNTARIQRAIDYVASLVPDASGFRGAVLLIRENFHYSKCSYSCLRQRIARE